MLLIFPPLAKPSEPPAGVAKLAGVLRAAGISCHLLDMNLEGMLYLMQEPRTGTDTWTRRAVRNVSKNISALRDPAAYRSFDRYSRAVLDLNRALEAAGKEQGLTIGLADYHDAVLSPVRSGDLLRAAEQHEKSIFYPYFKGRLREVLQDEPVVGFSLNYLSQALTTFAMIGFIKKECPEIRIILGGGLVTSWMRRPGWNNPFRGLVNDLVCGPGEGPLLALLGGNEAVHTSASPSYEGLELTSYLSPGFILPYSGSSGCYWNKCSFCPERAEGNTYSVVPAARALADINALASKTNPVLIHLLDNAVSPALMRLLAKDPPRAPWYGFARIERDLLDRDYCRSLAQSGCRLLKLGLESGDQGVLDAMHKGIDLETVSRALLNLKQAGIAAYVYLLFGTPAESAEEARRTLDFTARHHEEITFLNLAVFNMPLGSTDQVVYDTEPFYEGDLSLYKDFRHPHGWERKEVRRFLDSEFKRHKAVAAILRRDPPIFTSNHAAFFA